MATYRFMWGQKQSAMITEVMRNQLLFVFGIDGKIKNSNISEDLFILTDGVFEHFMPAIAISDWEQHGKRYLNVQYSAKLHKMIERHLNSFFTFCRALEKKKVTTLTDKQLRAIMSKYQNYLKKTFIFFGTSTPELTAIVVMMIKNILLRKFKSKMLVEDYLIALSSPAEPDETMRERLDFLKLISLKNIGVNYLVRHAKKYPALFFNTYNEKEVVSFLKARIKQEKGMSWEAENNRIKTNLLQIKRRQQEIFKQVADRRLPHFAGILQRCGLDRYRLKHGWSGAEYLCLNFIKEVAKRIGINFESFIKCYLFEDIYNFFDKGYVLTSRQLADRKKCLLIHYSRGQTKIVTGDAALAYRRTLLGEKKTSATNESVIRGSIANKGFVTGNARIVNVKDLNHFIKDCKLFKRGEILVTTMTSPVMVPIIEKAAGIITDEGGITSHAAVVSREFNIPCLVGTAGGSAIIKTGDVVELDANSGSVKIIKKFDVR